MTVTPDSGDAPWDGGSRDPYQPQPPAHPPSGPAHSPLTPAQPPTEPVRRDRGGRLRWIVAGLASLLVIAVVAVVFLLANPPSASGGLSPLARLAPRDSVVYIEARLDLPGDQRDNVISFMGHFPGFADPATFDQKISDTLDQILRSSQDEVGWKSDIEPWFGGQVVAFLGQAVFESGEGTPQSGTVAISVKDRAALEAWLERERSGSDSESSEYRGVTIWTLRMSGERASLAVLDDALLLSLRIEDMHATLDVNADAAEGLQDDARFGSAMATLTGDRLLAFYMDGQALKDSIESEMGAMPFTSAPLLGQLENFPAAVVGQLRAASDHLVLEMRATPQAGKSFPDQPQNRSSTLIGRFPADVVGYGEVRDLGAGIKQAITQTVEMLAEMGGGSEGIEETMRQAEQFLGTRPEDFFDFVGDAGVALSAEGDRYGGGLIAAVNDEEVARQRMERLVTTLRTALAFAGPDVPLTIEEQTHGSATLTVFRLRGDVPGMEDLPISSLSFTVANGLLLMGTDDFVTDALDRSEADSLGANSGFRNALTQAGQTNGGFFYLNVGELRRIVETNVPADERAEIAPFWPFFERFSHFIGSVANDGDAVVARVLLFVE